MLKNVNNQCIMRNYYFISAMVGLLSMGCSVDNDELTSYSDLKSVNASICGVDAGSDKSVILTNDFAESNLYTPARLSRFYLKMLDPNVSKDGVFNPSPKDLINSYLGNNFQVFTTTYTITEDGCSDSVDLSIEIMELIQDPLCSAGEDKFVRITNDFAMNNLYTPARLSRYYLKLLDPNVSKDGVFNPSTKDLINSYQKNNFQVFTTTYTITEDGCSDSVDLSIEVVGIPGDPICSAGEDKFVTITNDYALNNLYTPARVSRYYLNLLDPNVAKDGVFDPSPRELIDSYLLNNFQVFTTTYTITEDDCSDSVELSVKVEN